MKNGPLLFLSLFGALVLSWAGIVLGTNAQLGQLAPHFDENEGKAFPERASGLASRGQLVYADLDCAACHTQQVRRPDFGTDQARGWGDRQSFARDYIYQTRVQLGEMRVGPDLTNLGVRKPPYDADLLFEFLYTGVVPLAKTVTHPPYKFLFEKRPVVGEPSRLALKLTRNPPSVGEPEIVPSERVQTLVAYLLSLNSSYNYPSESAVNTIAPAKEEAHPAAPAAHGDAGKAAAPTAPKEGHK